MQWVYLIIGLALGLVLGWTIARLRASAELARLRAERQAESDKVEWTRLAREELERTFGALAGEALTSSKDQFLGDSQRQLKGLVDPLAQSLKDMNEHVQALESKRSGAYSSLQTELDRLSSAHTELRDSAMSLRQALKSSTDRGTWGEYQLERVLRLSGMTKNIHYKLQERTEQGQPDATVSLPNEGVLYIDAKAPVPVASSETTEISGITPEDAAAAIRSHIVALGRRSYWKGVAQTPEVVVMFVPSEALFARAFEHDSTLLDYSVQQKILLTTPITLLALLKTVAYGWNQLRIAEHAEEIAQEGAKLHDRMAVFLGHLQELGKRLDKAVEFYNKAIGSYQSRLRKTLEDFKSGVGSQRELPDPEQLDRSPQLPLDPTGE